MAWARTIANDKNDSYAGDVLFELIQLLSGSEVPDADHLMSTLVCAYPIVLDMMDSGDLVPGEDESASVLKNPAEFNNELCRICREYAAVDAQIREIPVGPDALTQKKQQIKDEEARLEAQVSDLETAEQDLNTQRTLAALRRQNLKKPLEEALSKLTGSPVRVRLNGQVPD
jgi:septal ring factor EnvC (AmiA/AmiB activator)